MLTLRPKNVQRPVPPPSRWLGRTSRPCPRSLTAPVVPGPTVTSSSSVRPTFPTCLRWPEPGPPRRVAKIERVLRYCERLAVPMPRGTSKATLSLAASSMVMYCQWEPLAVLWAVQSGRRGFVFVIPPENATRLGARKAPRFPRQGLARSGSWAAPRQGLVALCRWRQPRSFGPHPPLVPRGFRRRATAVHLTSTSLYLRLPKWSFSHSWTCMYGSLPWIRWNRWPLPLRRNGGGSEPSM